MAGGWCTAVEVWSIERSLPRDRLTGAKHARTLPDARNVRADDGSGWHHRRRPNHHLGKQTMASTTVPTNTPTFQRPPITEHQHRRRDLLGRLAGAAAVAAVPTVAEAGTDPHPAWEAELPALRAACRAVEDDDDLHDEACDLLWAVEELIMTTPAATLPGVMAQLRVVHAQLAEHRTLSNDEHETAALGHAVATLQRLGGRAAA